MLLFVETYGVNKTTQVRDGGHCWDLRGAGAEKALLQEHEFAAPQDFSTVAKRQSARRLQP